jgi:hypothetical protein
MRPATAFTCLVLSTVACGGGDPAGGDIDASPSTIDASATIDGAAAPDAELATPDAGFVAECVFGTSLADLMPPRFVQGGLTQHTDAGALTDLQRAQFVRAMHASTHDEVTTAEEALAAADEGVILTRPVRDDIAIRPYTLVTYGAGDNTYGAIFDDQASVALAEVHDGDIYECLVEPQTCIFGPLFGFGDVEGLTVGAGVVFTSADDLSDVERDQVAAAGQRWTAATTAAELLALVTDGEVVFTKVTHDATGRSFAFVTYILGDHRFGQAFASGTLDPVVDINDNVHERCDAF